jgi:hypothetical protein
VLNVRISHFHVYFYHSHSLPAEKGIVFQKRNLGVIPGKLNLFLGIGYNGGAERLPMPCRGEDCDAVFYQRLLPLPTRQRAGETVGALRDRRRIQRHRARRNLSPARPSARLRLPMVSGPQVPRVPDPLHHPGRRRVRVGSLGSVPDRGRLRRAGVPRRLAPLPAFERRRLG